MRIFYLFRIKTIAKFYIIPYATMLTYQALLTFLLLFLLLLTAISGIVYTLEMAITTFFNALYVVFGHLLFFGHRIFLIEHIVSIALLTIVSITGVILQGLALQWVFTKAEMIYRRRQYRKREQASRSANRTTG